MDRLELAGLVRRDPEPGDRRRVLVVPLPDRQRLVTALFQSVSTG